VEVSLVLFGIIFSDLGQAGSFMALDWVREGLHKSLGFAPFPATLNLRPKADKDAETWEAVQNGSGGIFLAPTQGRFCSARLYPVRIHGREGSGAEVPCAVLLPDVKDYPRDKIEVVAPMHLKEALGVKDGDLLKLEFVN
jgi:CTP-dependent riboflavin kinase